MGRVLDVFGPWLLFARTLPATEVVEVPAHGCVWIEEPDTVEMICRRGRSGSVPHESSARRRTARATDGRFGAGYVAAIAGRCGSSSWFHLRGHLCQHDGRYGHANGYPPPRVEETLQDCPLGKPIWNHTGAVAVRAGCILPCSHMALPDAGPGRNVHQLCASDPCGSCCAAGMPCPPADLTAQTQSSCGCIPSDKRLAQMVRAPRHWPSLDPAQATPTPRRRSPPA